MENLPEGRLKRIVIITTAIALMATPIANVLIEILRVTAKALEVFASK